VSLTQVTPDVISTNTISGLISSGFTSMNVATFGTQTIEFGSSNTLVFRANTASERMRIDSVGNVGIGTGSNTVNRKFVLYDSVNPTMQFADPTSTTAAGAGSLLQHTTATGSLVVRTYDANASIIFQTTGASERLRIANTGNIGIATTAPAQRLHIGLTGANNYIQFGTTDEGFVIGRENSTGEFTFDATQASPYNVFKWRQSGTERMRITSAGDVLIGTTTTLIGSRFGVKSSNNSLAAFTGADAAGTSYFVQTNGSGQINHYATWATSGVNAYHAWWTTTSGGSQTQAMTLDVSGNLGIGTSSPSSLMHLSSSVTNSGGTGTEILRVANFRVNTGSSGAAIRFVTNEVAGTNQYVRAQITGEYDDSSDNNGRLLFATTNTGGSLVERMRIRSHGTVILQGGSTTATGTGITFPATQNASSDANTLDDYEEGTFTPTIGGTVSDGTATYSTQVGQYTKIGNRVFFIIRLGWSSGTGSGSMVIRGLPFTQFNGNGDIPYAASEWSEIAWSANYSPTPVGGQNTTIIYLNQSRIGGSGTADNTAYDNAGFMSLTGHYRIA
jgi:hypothetical protein